MQHFDSVTILSALCKAAGKSGLYVSFGWHEGVPTEEWFSNLKKAMPYLDDDLHMQIVADECGWFLFDTREECEKVFWSTVGDDGPTETNPYNGPVRVYAITCDADGQLGYENT